MIIAGAVAKTLGIVVLAILLVGITIGLLFGRR